MNQVDAMRLAALLERRVGDGGDDEQTPCLEARLDTLREYYGNYVSGCPFQPGDLVTPRRGVNVRGCGEPRIVLEVFDPPIRKAGECGTHLDGARQDMRVLCYVTGDYVAYMAESWQYSPWTEQ